MKTKKYVIKSCTLLMMLLFSFTSCNKDEELNTEPVPDCNCDEIMEFTTFNLLNEGQFGTYITINQCTGVQENGDWDNFNGGPTPYAGMCW